MTYSPTMATFLPGPAPNLLRGEYVVKPAQSIGAAKAVSRLSGILKVKYSCARMWLEYPPCDTIPSSLAPYVSIWFGQ